MGKNSLTSNNGKPILTHHHDQRHYTSGYCPTAEWLRQKEKAGFIILSIVKVTNTVGTTANVVEFRPKEFQETPDLPQLLALKGTEEADQRAEIAAILKQGNRPSTSP